MALSKAMERKAPTTVEERTWRANIETPRGGDYSIQVYRQISYLDEDGEVVGKTELNTTPVSRMAKDIVKESVTLPDGTEVPAALILAALPLFFDRWAEEDASKPKDGL